MFRAPFSGEPWLPNFFFVAANGHVPHNAMDGRDSVSPIFNSVPNSCSFKGGEAKGEAVFVVRGSNGVTREIRDEFVACFVSRVEGREISVFYLIVNPGNYVMYFAAKAVRRAAFYAVSAFNPARLNGDRRAVWCEVKDVGGGVIPPLVSRYLASNAF